MPILEAVEQRQEHTPGEATRAHTTENIISIVRKPIIRAAVVVRSPSVYLACLPAVCT